MSPKTIIILWAPRPVGLRSRSRAARGRRGRGGRAAAAHPMMSLSHLRSSDSSTAILEDTLLPPTTATKGRAGAVTTALRKLSS